MTVLCDADMLAQHLAKSLSEFLKVQYSYQYPASHHKSVGYRIFGDRILMIPRLFDEEIRPNTLQMETIGQFKGLDKDVVICVIDPMLWRFSSVDSPGLEGHGFANEDEVADEIRQLSLLNVGLSRARLALSVVSTSSEVVSQPKRTYRANMAGTKRECRKSGGWPRCQLVVAEAQDPVHRAS